MRTGNLIPLAALAALLLFGTGCAADTNGQQSDIPSTNDAVASADEMAGIEDVVTEDMTPIDGSQVRDGVYDVTVDSSSSMFRIVACRLTVKDGSMTAQMTMGGTGYRYVYMGTGEQAAAADEAAYIPFVEDAAGAHTYTVPAARAWNRPRR